MSEPDDSKKFYSPPVHDCLGKIRSIRYKGNSEENLFTLIQLYDYDDTYTMVLPYYRYILMEAYYRNLLVNIPGYMCKSKEKLFSRFDVAAPLKDNNWTSIPKPTLEIHLLPPGHKP